MAFLNADNLPSTIGVYFFKKGGNFLYVGKSVNIKARVKSHLGSAKLDNKESLIVSQSDKLDYLITDSEFKAILLEAALIQKYHPKYNVIWQDNKSFLYIKVTVEEEYPKILLSRLENDGKSRYFGPFSSIKTTTNILREVRKIIPFCMQKNIKSRPCFYSKIGLCAPCPSAIIRLDGRQERKKLKALYRQNIRKVVKILEGEVDTILNYFYKQVKKLSKEKKYEEAISLRNKIIRLQQLLRRQNLDFNLSNLNRSDESLKNLIALLSLYFPKIKSLERIECYDISNISGLNATASMVVLSRGLVDKTQYRRFKIKNLKAKSDLAMLEEVFKRRFAKLKAGWIYPNLIVVDGGSPQVRAVREVLAKLHIDIPIIGLAKNPDRLVLGLRGLPTIQPARNNLGFNLIQHLRDESHRFAHKYHLLLRERELLL